MTPRRIVDLTFMSLVLVAGLAGAAQARLNLPTTHHAVTVLVQEAFGSIQDSAAVRRVPRGDDARQRTREAAQSAGRGGGHVG